ncbi:Insulin-degrading enzyme [Eufriesea mexicana]|uniref:Insulin-degrading enzyme n=1 Tax=Eufriesea mexicana TaxID=516756 RepID=A0A310SUM4_9HYME|nr:Insulin-degrading enzyme [Eufriesea mexicana]
MASLLQNDKILRTDITTAKCKSSNMKITTSNMAPHNHIEKRYENIIKSPNDKREYRGLLLSNKMKVLLISDPTTDKRTEKYPEKNDYNKYLSQNGGTYNASTHMDHTLYYFDVHAEKLRGALDRFAQFFIAPLFTESLTELELNAIHLECEKNLANDTWRLDQLEKSSADPNHPFSKFDAGNKETLDILPKQKGINSLDELEKMVIELFSQVKNKEIAIPTWPQHPFNEQHFQHKWYIVPIKDIRNLYIIFPIPDLTEHYKSSPAYYISHLLGHEGEGSLLSLLKAKGWCNSLGSEEGTQHVDDIVLLTFQYINMLKKHGPVEWIYNECRDIANINFKFKEKSYPCDYVSSIAQRLYDYPMEDILTVEYLFPLWKPDLIKWVMGYLKPENVRIHVIGKSYENIADETEKWYGVKFKKEKISQNVINEWINAGLNLNLKLPPKNEFIPEKFDIKPTENNISKFPVIIEDTPLIRLWFKQDDEFVIPRANLFIDFVSPLAYMDPLNCNLTYIFVLLFRDALNEYAYAAEIVGLRWELTNSRYGMILRIVGYDDKQHVLLDKIIDKMINFKVDPKRFEIWKENYIRNLKNYKAEQPYQHAVYYLTVLLSELMWMKEELLNATSYLTVERVQNFIPQFLSKLHMECLIHGNVTMSEAIETAKLIESKLSNTNPHIVPLLSKQLVLHREIKLDDGCHFLLEVKTKFHTSSCTQVYYQTGLQSTESNMLLELLAQILSEPCFTMLRTKEQLGYIVFSGVRRANGAQGLRIIVQSDRHPKYVEQKINVFLNSMLQYISSMTEEEFNAHKESLAVRRLEKPKQMTILSTIFWSEITAQQYNFDRANIEVAYLRTITQEQILQFYEDILRSDIQRKLSVHVVSTLKDTNSEDEKIIKSEENIADEIDTIEYKNIDDIMIFKISQCLYPLMKPFTDIPRKGVHSYCMSQKIEKPILSGQRIKTRKRDEKEKYDPMGFRDAILLGLEKAGNDLDAISKYLDTAGSKLDYRRYGEDLFDILIAGGLLVPGGSIAQDGDKPVKTTACVFEQPEDMESMRNFEQVFIKLMRRYKYLEKMFEEEMKKVLVFMKGFTPKERIKLARMTALWISNGSVPPTVLSVLINEHLVKDNLALDFLLEVFVTWRQEKGLPSLMTALKKGNIEGRLMEFVPPNKRTEEYFRSVFEAVGLADIVKLHKAQASQEAKRDLQQLLLDDLADNRPMKDIILDLKEMAQKSGIPEHEVIVMGQAEWNKKEELVADQALKHLKVYNPLFDAFTTTARSELALILKVQEFCYENMNFMKVFQRIVLLFYKIDVISEEVILKWYKEGHSVKGKMLFLDQMKKFIEWLQNAEEESESGEEDD